MKVITNEDMYTMFIIDGSPYIFATGADKSVCEVGDIFVDFRTGEFKEVETLQDIADLCFMAPETFCKLKEVNLFKILEEEDV